MGTRALIYIFFLKYFLTALFILEPNFRRINGTLPSWHFTHLADRTMVIVKHEVRHGFRSLGEASDQHTSPSSPPQPYSAGVSPTEGWTQELRGCWARSVRTRVSTDAAHPSVYSARAFGGWRSNSTIKASLSRWWCRVDPLFSLPYVAKAEPAASRAAAWRLLRFRSIPILCGKPSFPGFVFLAVDRVALFRQ